MLFCGEVYYVSNSLKVTQCLFLGLPQSLSLPAMCLQRSGGHRTKATFLRPQSPSNWAPSSALGKDCSFASQRKVLSKRDNCHIANKRNQANLIKCRTIMHLQGMCRCRSWYHRLPVTVDTTAAWGHWTKATFLDPQSKLQTSVSTKKS